MNHLSEESIRQLARNWIQYWEIASDPDRNTRTFRKQIASGEHPLSDVTFKEAELVNKHPAAAWQLILELVAQTHNEKILALIAAGPLEDLLNRYPDDYKKLAQEMARKDPRFRQCLEMVW